MLNSEQTKVKYIDAINSTEIKHTPKLKKIQIVNNFINGGFVEITGNLDSEFVVSFYDNDTNNLLHQSTIGCNMWTKTNRQYFTNWRIEVKDLNGNLMSEHILDLKGKRVYISIDSSSIGDNIAWVPYLDEFRKKHGCILIASTFWNDLFKSEYPEIEFIKPGETVNDLYAMYKVGAFYNENLEPELCNTIPLQKIATNILGLEFNEIKPEINTDTENKFPFMLTEKYVAIAPHSTAGLKYWNNPSGWQEVINYLTDNGYTIFNVSREGCDLNNVTNLDDYSMDEIIRCIKGSEFFIGLSSGLSWLAWAMNKHVFLISNFTNKEHEFNSNCTRIVNESVCNACWVKPEFKFDKGDWNWCPIHKGTERQFECSKSITGEYVINKIKSYLIDGVFDWGSSSVELINNLKQEIFYDKIYERVFSVNEGDVVVDIGASVGPFTYSILDKKPKMVYSLEPSTFQYKTLLKNIVDKPVKPINKGVTLIDGPFTSDYIFGEDSEEVMSGICFKTFLEDYNIDKIDFLKLDCEGGEYDVLNQENLHLIKGKVKKISAEFHLRSPDFKFKFKEFITNVLPELGIYKVYTLDGYDVTDILYTDEFIPRFNEVMIYIIID
jgi:autotransporter strand-loop-strand O-heptosyltransferase